MEDGNPKVDVALEKRVKRKRAGRLEPGDRQINLARGPALVKMLFSFERPVKWKLNNGPVAQLVRAHD